MNEKFEYGVQITNAPDSEPHRTGMTAEQAIEWIKDTESMGGVPKGAFSLIRRIVGPWERP
jgi:hypothetical protein